MNIFCVKQCDLLVLNGTHIVMFDTALVESQPRRGEPYAAVYVISSQQLHVVKDVSLLTPLRDHLTDEEYFLYELSGKVPDSALLSPGVLKKGNSELS